MNTTNDKPAIFGNYKEYLLIERSDLHELKDRARELFAQAENDTAAWHRADAITECVKFLKERNIYNREFKYNG
jgi:hypothetical protein